MIYFDLSCLGYNARSSSVKGLGRDQGCAILMWFVIILLTAFEESEWAGWLVGCIVACMCITCVVGGVLGL